MSKKRILTVVVLGLLVVGAQAIAQTPADVNIPAYYIQDQITSLALEGNVLGDPATRPLLVYLPPSYDKEPERRYPTIYFLHGFGGIETDFASGGGIGSLATEMMAAGKMGEVIIVLPNASNSYGGSWYQRNSLIGDYRTYLAKELVTYIDTKYRTLADREHRAISGISMGGYGALSLAIEYSDVYGAVAALSPVADIQAVADLPGEPDPNAIDAFVASYPEVVGVPGVGDFIADIFYAWAASWTPNLSNPPYFVDLPVKYPEKTAIPEIWQKWVDADLVSQVQRDGANLAQTAVLVVSGRGPITIMAEVPAGTLVAALYEKAISFTYTATPGDHMSDILMKVSAALEFLYPHISAPVGTQ